MSYNSYRPSGFGGFSFFPPVIKNLLIINGVVFLLQMLGQNITTSDGWSLNDIITKYFALIPIGGYNVANGMGQISHWAFYPWQLITYQFMHGGFSHILFNMFALWMFGIEIENIWGSKKFLYFYLMCGVVAGLFQLFLTPLLTGMGAPTIGASGAIYGVLIAFGMLFPNRYIFLWFFIPIKAKYLIAGLILLEFFGINSAGSNIAHLAHLGGALAAFVYLMLDPKVNVAVKNIFKRTSYRTKKPFNPFGGMANSFKKKHSDVEEANFYEVKDEKDENISQADIDEILDKISRSGYQNLTEREKKILFEASKKMK